MLGYLWHPIDPALRPRGFPFHLNASYIFADRMIFTATATSDNPITQATVFFQSGSQPPYSHPADPFTPANVVPLTATINLKETKLIPFSTVSYWWEAIDQSGQKARSATQSIVYVDNRFPWQDFASDPARVHWYQGDSGFGGAAANIASEAMPGIQQQIGVEPPSPLDVYVYASVDDLRSAVELAGREWLGGQARPELGVVLVAIPPGDSARLQMRRDIPHELTHLMTFVAASPNYDAVPRWLDEGLATLNEGEPNSTQVLVVQDALTKNKLIPIESLCGAFPTDAWRRCWPTEKAAYCPADHQRIWQRRHSGAVGGVSRRRDVQRWRRACLEHHAPSTGIEMAGSAADKCCRPDHYHTNLRINSREHPIMALVNRRDRLAVDRHPVVAHPQKHDTMQK
jgi:hypothetical protein